MEKILEYQEAFIEYPKSNIQHWDRNSNFLLFISHGYFPSLDFDDF